MSRMTRPQIGLEPAQASVGALELMGMGIALMLDQRQLADPRIGLAQFDTDMRGKPYQAFPRSVKQLGIGREHHRLRLHRRIDDHARQVLRLHRLSPRRHR